MKRRNFLAAVASTYALPSAPLLSTPDKEGVYPFKILTTKSGLKLPDLSEFWSYYLGDTITECCWIKKPEE
jgi:hypothetical protein